MRFLNVSCYMINLHSFRKSGSGAMCSVVGKNPGGGGGGTPLVKPTSIVGAVEAKRLRRSEAEAEADEAETDVGSEGSSSTKGDKGRHSTGRMGWSYYDQIKAEKFRLKFFPSKVPSNTSYHNSW